MRKIYWVSGSCQKASKLMWQAPFFIDKTIFFFFFWIFVQIVAYHIFTNQTTTWLISVISNNFKIYINIFLNVLQAFLNTYATFAAVKVWKNVGNELTVEIPRYWTCQHIGKFNQNAGSKGASNISKEIVKTATRNFAVHKKCADHYFMSQQSDDVWRKIF